MPAGQYAVQALRTGSSVLTPAMAPSACAARAAAGPGAGRSEVPPGPVIDSVPAITGRR